MAKKQPKTKAPALSEIKKGDTVYMFLFSGAKVGRDNNAFEVADVTDKAIVLETGRGTRKFSKKTGIQINAEKPRYSNFIITDREDEESRLATVSAIQAKAKALKESEKAEEPAKKPAKPKKKDTEEKPVKKPKAKAKKPKAEPEEEDEDMEDD